MKHYAIIVAGGSGKRMQSNVCKQFLILNHLPILMHTINAFYHTVYKPEIILVLGIDSQGYWADLCKEYNFEVPHQIISGGEQRFHSVRNGLLAIKEEGIVAIHDAVRPLVSKQLIERMYEQAAENGNAIPYVKTSDSLRQISNNTSKIVNREQYVMIQTPQTFITEQLKKAYQQNYKQIFTDDASVVENAGFKINLVEGERNNLKITYPEDLRIASFLLGN